MDGVLMEVWLSVAEKEIVDHPLLYSWLLSIQNSGLDQHEFVFDFDSGKYKIRPKRQESREGIETVKSLCGLGETDG
jgi:hypothetical protein